MKRTGTLTHRLTNTVRQGLLRPAVVVALLLPVVACSTKKNTWISRTYHNINAEFNVKFNGNESYKEGVKKADGYLPQDYSQLPPVFAYAYKDMPGKVAGEMDRVIQKCEKLVVSHSITVKPKKKPASNANRQARDFYNQKEFCAVVDDAYLLNGKARLYLQEYDKAVVIFEHILQEYPKSSSAAEAKLQLAGALIRRDEPDRAQRLLQESEKAKDFPKKLRALRDATYADLYIQQKNYSEAAGRLESALRHGAKKADKIRYYFILAELYGQTGSPSQAVNHLNRAVRLHPPYQVVFAAQMRKAALYNPATQHLNLRRDLLDMLNDAKNAEFKDQIYYALGLVEKAHGNDTAAIGFFNRSVAAESSNEVQHGLSYLLLGDYARAARQYVDAYAHYTRALQLLGTGYEQYDTLQTKVAGLQKLAENDRIIRTEDSLQRLAALPAAEREQWISAQIALITEQERQVQQEQRQQQFLLYQQQDRTVADSRSGAWYFYNPSAVNAGRSTFNLRWGRRRLEDDWRRKNKQSIAPFATVPDAATPAADEQPALSGKSREYYTQNLPLTPEALAASNERLSGALFKLGEAYKDDVREPLPAIAAFRQLDARFPQHGSRASIYYYLYQLYTDTQKPDSAAWYKQQLIQQYPKGALAQQLTNPNYFAEQRAAQARMETAYEAVYSAYTGEQYAEADALAQQLLQQYPNSLLQPQLEYIRAMCTGARGDREGYKAALTALTGQYPATDVAATAAELLARLEQPAAAAAVATADTADTPADTTRQVVFVSAAAGTHYAALLCEQQNNPAGLLFAIESYNADTHLESNLEAVTHPLGNRQALIVVRAFDTPAAAGQYLSGWQHNEQLRNLLPAGAVKLLISPKNLELLLQSKDMAAYRRFHTLNYPEL